MKTLRTGWSCLSAKSLTALLAILTLVAIGRLWWMPVLVTGDSMSPAFESGALVWMRKLGPREPRRWDIVLARTSVGLVTKRIVALPGERVSMVNGLLYINGELFPEPHLPPASDWTLAEGKIGPNHYLLVGDNRRLSEKVVFLAEQSDIIAFRSALRR